jgi:hypothetical protein
MRGDKTLQRESKNLRRKLSLVRLPPRKIAVKTLSPFLDTSSEEVSFEKKKLTMEDLEDGRWRHVMVKPE